MARQTAEKKARERKRHHSETFAEVRAQETVVDGQLGLWAVFSQEIGDNVLRVVHGRVGVGVNKIGKHHFPAFFGHFWPKARLFADTICFKRLGDRKRG